MFACFRVLSVVDHRKSCTREWPQISAKAGLSVYRAFQSWKKRNRLGPFAQDQLGFELLDVYQRQRIIVVNSKGGKPMGFWINTTAQCDPASPPEKRFWRNTDGKGALSQSFFEHHAKFIHGPCRQVACREDGEREIAVGLS